jgi:hypothetical protein
MGRLLASSKLHQTTESVRMTDISGVSVCNLSIACCGNKPVASYY